MRVLLTRDAKGLGKAGEIKEVKDSYEQNFLIVKSFARAATNKVLRKYESSKRRKAGSLRSELVNLEKLKDGLSKITLEISEPVGTNGSLSGGVAKEDIALTLREQKNIGLGKKSLKYDTVKTLGIHTIGIKLGHAIRAGFKIGVKAE